MARVYVGDAFQDMHYCRWDLALGKKIANVIFKISEAVAAANAVGVVMITPTLLGKIVDTDRKLSSRVPCEVDLEVSYLEKSRRILDVECIRENGDALVVYVDSHDVGEAFQKLEGFFVARLRLGVGAY